MRNSRVLIHWDLKINVCYFFLHTHKYILFWCKNKIFYYICNVKNKIIICILNLNFVTYSWKPFVKKIPRTVLMVKHFIYCYCQICFRSRYNFVESVIKLMRNLSFVTFLQNWIGKIFYLLYNMTMEICLMMRSSINTRVVSMFTTDSLLNSEILICINTNLHKFLSLCWNFTKQYI